jgi:hypothetical protein
VLSQQVLPINSFPKKQIARAKSRQRNQTSRCQTFEEETKNCANSPLDGML